MIHRTPNFYWQNILSKNQAEKCIFLKSKEDALQTKIVMNPGNIIGPFPF